VNVLIVTAVAVERDACAAAAADVCAVGAGPVEAAAGTSALLAPGRYDVVISAGIAGGMGDARVGDLVVADEIIFADLGAETPNGFRSSSSLGFGAERYPVDPDLVAELARRTDASIGTILTVATVTGSADTATTLTARHPAARAEAMEGAGVAAAAARFGVRYAELRSISNLVGPRDRAEWRVDGALQVLGRAVRAIGALE
jgi:futalosine hydrolase